MRAIVGAVVLLAGSAALAGCDSGPSQSLLPDKQAKAGGGSQSADALLGMWSWQTENIVTNLYGNDTIRYHKGSFMVTPGTAPGQYKIALNFTQHSNVGSYIEKATSSQQQCTGIQTGNSFAIQCTIDPNQYPNWTPADFSFQVNGNTMTGALLSDANANVSATKL